VGDSKRTRIFVDGLNFWKTSSITCTGKASRARRSFFAFNLHPFFSGVLFRTKIVDEFIRYAKGF
jgi:hypothetical protein